jgi:hypothetical protein
VRGRLALLAAGAAAAVAVTHKLRRRRVRVVPEAPPEPGPDPRADELREKLAASREVVDERDADEERETPVDEAVDVAAGGAEVDARREEIHARGKAAAAEMRSDPAERRATG